MPESAWSPSMPALRGPWFRLHARIAISVASALYVAVLLLTVFAGSPGDAYFLLYVFPIALLALTFGCRAGLAAGLVAVGLIVGWAVVRSVSFTATGWLAHAVPMVVLGVLLGRAADRMRSAEAARVEVEAAALLHREAVEINDLLVQGMAAARWSFQAGQIDAGLQILDETLTQAQELVSELIRRAGTRGRSHSVAGITGSRTANET
ncbi:hypothetical protein [Kribbella sp. NPDC048915]|uniref:hypothetical protein n=1 Tax=Kribbella sp. NPDC048915 TaxID=3155148 RepID=UPI0033F20CF1